MGTESAFYPWPCCAGRHGHEVLCEKYEEFAKARDEEREASTAIILAAKQWARHDGGLEARHQSERALAEAVERHEKAWDEWYRRAYYNPPATPRQPPPPPTPPTTCEKPTVFGPCARTSGHDGDCFSDMPF